MKCIYCHTTKKDLFKGREHVIPRSFGTFGTQTPTLHCVCDDCNAYFKKELDQVLARDTIEGVTRYKKGILSREQQFPKNVEFSIDDKEEYGDFKGAILGGYEPMTGKNLSIVGQFWLFNIQTNKWEKYKIDQIKDIKITEEKYGSSAPGNRQMKIMAPSEKEYDEIIEELKKYNIPYREKEILGPPSFIAGKQSGDKLELSINIQGTIDKRKKRALVKILFNFATYYLDKEETFKSEWDKTREFVRNDGEDLLGRISQEPFWNGQETKQIRFSDNSYNLRIENKGGNIIGVIQFYNIFTYEFILVEKYSISPEKEIACRFTPGEEPYVGFKITRIQ